MPLLPHEEDNNKFMSTGMLKFVENARVARREEAEAAAAAAATAAAFAAGHAAGAGAVAGAVAVRAPRHSGIDDVVRSSPDPCARFLAAVAATTGESVEELAGLSDWRRDLDKQLQELETRVDALRDEAVKKLLESAAKESKLELLAAARGAANGAAGGESVVLQLRDSETASRLRDLQSGDATAGFFDRFSALIDRQKSDADLTLSDTLASLDQSIHAMAARARERIEERAAERQDEHRALSLSHRLRAAMEEAVTVAERERRGAPLRLQDLVTGALALRSAFAELVGLVYLSQGTKSGGVASYVTASSITELVIRARVALRRVQIELVSTRV